MSKFTLSQSPKMLTEYNLDLSELIFDIEHPIYNCPVLANAREHGYGIPSVL